MGRFRSFRKVGEGLVGDKDSREIKYEQSGEINILQRYRLVEHWEQYDSEPPNISHKLLFVDEDLREVVQEETSIKDGPYNLRKDSQERLDALNIQYWILAQKW